jgi:spermidine synthase
MNRALFACVLSGAVGFLSLSQEILFVRTIGFAFQSTPTAFGFVLAFFLLGIALGANAGKRVCTGAVNLRRAGGLVLLGAGAVDLVIPYALGGLAATTFDGLGMAVLIVAAAALKSVLFPIAHQLGGVAKGPRMGASISRVYAANVAGSTLGPLLTGFVLLDVASTEHGFLLVGAGTLALGVACLADRRNAAAFAGGAGAVAAVALAFAFPARMLEQFMAPSAHGAPISRVIENRSGIIHVVARESGGDEVFGGNVYDGRINTSLRINSNYINRAYLLAALHPRPARVLVIGMSSAAWTWVLTRIPDVRTIDVIEINPGYVELVRDHPEVASILDDPRVSIHIDDGRRWLSLHSEARYDLIVMNTTFHWRGYATNLLSSNFLEVARARLNPGGILAFNTTSSDDTVWTANHVFPFVRRYMNFVYASDGDFVTPASSRLARIYAMRDRGVPLLDAADPVDAQAVAKMMAIRFEAPGDVWAHASRPLEIITDDNMITEYRYGRRITLLPPFD